LVNTLLDLPCALDLKKEKKKNNQTKRKKYLGIVLLTAHISVIDNSFQIISYRLRCLQQNKILISMQNSEVNIM
jgi:hypothetical protein